MKHKILIGVLILGVVLGMISQPVFASMHNFHEGDDPSYRAVQQQVLTAPFINDMYIEFWSNDIIYYKTNNLYGAVDVFGNTVMEPIYQHIYVWVWDGYSDVKLNDKHALFYNGRQLTPFCYDTIEKTSLCFRATIDGKNEILDKNGKKLPIDKFAKDNWVLMDAIPNKAILLYRPSLPEYSPDGTVQYTGDAYRLIDWNGNTIEKTGYRTTILNEYSYSVESGVTYYRVEYLDPSKKPISRPKGFSECSEADVDGNLYHILYDFDTYTPEYKDYYLYDKDYNLICPLDIPATTHVPAISLTNDTFLMKKTGGSAIMNYRGEVVKELPGYFVTFIGLEVSKCELGARRGYCAHTDRFIMKTTGGSYICDKEGNQLAFMEGAYNCENKGYYITAQLGDKAYAIYDADGNFLFGYTESDSIKVLNGVIVQQKGKKYAILDRSGNAITEYIFDVVNGNEIEVYGAIYTIMDNRIYIVNHLGEFLNDVGFDTIPKFHGNYCAYTVDGKTGFLRLVATGDDLFLDVPSGEWYHDAVEACAELELFNGTGAAKFSPEDTMTRAMLVTVLWRLDGKKTPKETVVFTDVPEDTWYTEAVAWAAENGIVNGVGDEKFEPEGSVTREQIATIFCRYAESKGIDTQKRADLSSYPDVAEISDYAKEAMAWVNAEGLIIGNKIGETVLLQPQGDATRAQVAAIFVRFVNTFIDN